MRTIILRTSIAALIALGLVWSCKSGNSADTDADYLPQDVLQSCTLTPEQFATWFDKGKVSENGFVNAANSLTFGFKSNCDFYKWSEQMFLWMTSPADDFGIGKRVIESPVFYTVSPEDSLGHRTFIQHRKGLLLSAVTGLEKSIGIDSEEGQATGDALMAKDGSMVYYITMVNDVYAQFLTAVKDGKMSGRTFPTTQSVLDSIVAYAKTNNVTLPDATALAMEIKTSWVDVAKLKDADSYIQIDALVPTYDKTATKWTITGQRKARLALLGMHVVGSVAGHPEMVWSTFEHKAVSPNLSYTYVDKENKVKTVKGDIKGDWVLNSKPQDTVNINVSHMKFKGNAVYATFEGAPEGNTVSPSNSTRTKPWGVADSGVPNPRNATPAIANSEVISINNSIMSMLAGNDLRKNYMFIGSTWTEKGAAPNGRSYAATDAAPGVAVGSSQLANTTMETYIQNGTGYNKQGSCFLCHSSFNRKVPQLSPDTISHVFSDLKPLTIVVGGKTVKLK
ncbi:hypothetical protein [Flavobacterium magnum]|uniref:hypothetical protein n=1 Tax=Flavobacterium magnum TaxID=2162713 RepID=UPI0011B23C50|nr:hypothetical protein [Flavobacterium magnum]